MERAEAGAERANLAKSDFLGGMGDEINSPMNAIPGITDKLRETRLDVEDWALEPAAMKAGDDTYDRSHCAPGRLLGVSCRIHCVPFSAIHSEDLARQCVGWK